MDGVGGDQLGQGRGFCRAGAGRPRSGGAFRPEVFTSLRALAISWSVSVQDGLIPAEPLDGSADRKN